MNEPKTYTANDIERYHKGEMTAAEMHQLEKAALDDPALADALEGYVFTPTASADLQMLQSRLQQRIGEEKRKAVVFNLQWLKVAAVIILLAGGAWLAFKTMSSKNDELAKGNAVEIGKEKNTTVQKTDSASSLVQTPFSVDTTRANNDVAKADAKGYFKKAPASFGRLQKTTTLANKTPSAAPTNNTVGYVTLTPSPQERSIDSTSNIVAFKARTAAPTANAVKDTTRLNIVLEPLTAPPVDEVVINKNKQPSVAKRTNVTIDTLEPENGWHLFDEYIAENLKAPEEIKLKPSDNREVELHFDVDKEGNPINVTVMIWV